MAVSDLSVIAYKGRRIMSKYWGDRGLVQSSRMMDDHYSPDYIGFLPTPADVDEINRPMVLAAGIKETHRNYGTRLSDQEKQIVAESDWKNFYSYLSAEKLGYVAVIETEKSYVPVRHTKEPGHLAFKQTKKTVGFLRVYDASQSWSPCEVILNQKQVQTKVFQNFRDQGMHVYELGKYFLETSITPENRKFVRNELFQWLIENYLSGDKADLKNTIFIIDVSSRAHARAYQSMFGAQALDPSNFNPRLTDVDFVMTVSAKVLREHLLAILKSSSSGIYAFRNYLCGQILSQLAINRQP